MSLILFNTISHKFFFLSFFPSFFYFSDYDFEVNFTTSSVLKFTPNWKNDQRRLVCLAYNPTIVAHSNVNRSTLADVMTPIGVEPSNARIGINGIDSVWHTLPMGHHHLQHQQRSKTFVTDSLVLDIKCKCLYIVCYDVGLFCVQSIYSKLDSII